MAGVMLLFVFSMSFVVDIIEKRTDGGTQRERSNQPGGDEPKK
jgi:hypothetical protein